MKRRKKGINLTPEAKDPPVSTFEMDGWVCEDVSGWGRGCVGYPEARVIRKDGIQVILTNDCDVKMQGFPPSVVQWLLTGVKP